MNMRKKKNIFTVCIVAILLIAFSVYLVPDAIKPFFMAVSIISVTIFMIVFFAMWRCPHCGRSLGRLDNATHCKYCGKKLYENE